MEKRLVKETFPDAEFGEVNVKMCIEYPLTGKKSKWGGDERDYSNTADVELKGWEVYLHHSCDEWIIGSAEDAAKMAENLKEAVEYCNSRPVH